MASYSSSPWFFSIFFSYFLILIIHCNGDPTDGFTAVDLTEADFDLQSPYNLPQTDRYSFKNGIRKLWVYSNDKPHDRTTQTKPRTEIRMKGYDYSDGIWQFEGHGYVPSGTTGVSIMQIFGAASHATTFMLHTYNGQLWYYHQSLIEDNIYDRWFRLNVIHKVGENVTVFIDGVLKFVADDRGGESHYFKFGVYTQNDSSDYMESRWKDVKILQET
ncbi:hypothetical protein LUZ60_008778 [Juncus effusus]|nr:hypothetical protein LUZ60_008778 [Juncus effusus]